jgi:hypothetical protein
MEIADVLDHELHQGARCQLIVFAQRTYFVSSCGASSLLMIGRRKRSLRPGTMFASTRCDSAALMQRAADVVVVEVTAASASKNVSSGWSPALDPDVTRYFLRPVIHTGRCHRFHVQTARAPARVTALYDPRT